MYKRGVAGDSNGINHRVLQSILQLQSLLSIHETLSSLANFQNLSKCNSPPPSLPSPSWLPLLLRRSSSRTLLRSRRTPTPTARPRRRSSRTSTAMTASFCLSRALAFSSSRRTVRTVSSSSSLPPTARVPQPISSRLRPAPAWTSPPSSPSRLFALKHLTIPLYLSL